MNPNDEINKKYWSSVAPEKILSGMSIPGDEFLKTVPIGSHILDLGCGTGKVSEYLYEKGYKVTGIDINEKALEENKKRNLDISYIKADISEKLPFDDNTFDAIVISYVFVSIIDPVQRENICTELKRILKPGGYVWICEATYSEEYKERYAIGKEYTGMDHIALSISKNDEASALAKEKHFDELKARGFIERIIRHYSEKEIDSLFNGFSKSHSSQIAVTSPHSGMKVQSLVLMYKK